jgi:hypothetical protein
MSFNGLDTQFRGEIETPSYGSSQKKIELVTGQILGLDYMNDFKPVSVFIQPRLLQ